MSVFLLSSAPTDKRKFLGDLGVPSLPGGFLDVLSYFSRGGTGETDFINSNVTGVPLQGLTGSSARNSPSLQEEDPGLSLLNDPGPSNTTSVPPSRADPANGAPSVKGKGKEVAFVTPQLSNISRM